MIKNQDLQKPASSPKQAFVTPRPDSIKTARSVSKTESMKLKDNQDQNSGTVKNLDSQFDQSEALDELRSIMAEDDLVFPHQKTVESLRSALRSMSSERKLRNDQLERTVTILSIASQIAEKSLEIDALEEKMSEMGRKSFSQHGSLGETVARSKSLEKAAESKVKEDNLTDVEDIEVNILWYLIPYVQSFCQLLSQF